LGKNRWYWKDICEKVLPSTPGGQMMYQNTSPTWFMAAMENPNANVPPAFAKNAPTMVAMNALQVRSSYPVMVDPIGWEAGAGTKSQFWVAPNSPAPAMQYAIPRRTLVGMNANKQMAMRTFLLLDDMGYDSNGTAIATERLGQYSSSWLLKREQNSKRSDVSLTVVVYFRRSTETPSEEPAFIGTTPGANGGTVLTLKYNGSEKPAVRKGGWILDATMEVIPNQNDPNRYVDSHARYYRVTDVLEDNGSTIQVQLERALKPLFNPGTQIGSAPRMIVIQDRVLEVFEKGALDMGSPSRPN
jgi:hypothetical protein